MENPQIIPRKAISNSLQDKFLVYFMDLWCDVVLDQVRRKERQSSQQDVYDRE
jgi:hypothetical protein